MQTDVEIEPPSRRFTEFLCAMKQTNAKHLLFTCFDVFLVFLSVMLDRSDASVADRCVRAGPISCSVLFPPRTWQQAPRYLAVQMKKMYLGAPGPTNGRVQWVMKWRPAMRRCSSDDADDTVSVMTIVLGSEFWLLSLRAGFNFLTHFSFFFSFIWLDWTLLYKVHEQHFL